jgi:hypothetical protein
MLRCNGLTTLKSRQISELIAAKAAEKSVPVHSFVEDYALSGGYWLACAGSTISVTRTSLIGSIGAIFASFGLKELISSHGVERRVITAGKNKVLRSEDFKTGFPGPGSQFSTLVIICSAFVSFVDLYVVLSL